ncbi:hypothetical protein H072_10279 [Dactylellina haptotyla CBS 200.50]|uniref:Uncharacterized protein n=1 Tax=Dactylellina haptotyla (strain CBS 200.50) TaxID=1284197 RepID=S8A582_DACHA|nr:hypothetical protein H072_10279 [Dactylellina haptotyla CBS 200.50]
MSAPTSDFILARLSPYRRMYYRWKSLRLPWRKRYFIGMDLEGNTFWEFRDRLVATRPRRIMDFRGGVHSFVNYQEFKVDPQWHQWLRATRDDPPTINELEGDIIRKKVMQERARLADERWRKGGSYLRKPGEEEIRRLEGSAARTAASDGSLIGAAIAADTLLSAANKGEKAKGMKETTVEGMEEMLRVERERREKGRPTGPSEVFQPGEWAPRTKNPER